MSFSVPTVSLLNRLAPRVLASRVAISVAVALAYGLAGWVSLGLSIPPYAVSLLFIPAGLALGAVLIWGVWVLPGIALGALGIQWVASAQSGAQGWQWIMLVAPAGACIQACVTAWAVRRWVGYPSELDNPRRAFLFLLVLVPIGHLVNASVSVPVLWRSGVIPEAELLFNWWSWWQGDALGAVLFTPLMLVAFGQPAPAWRSRWATVAMPMLAAMAVVAAAFSQVQRSEQASIAAQFDQQSEALADRLQRRLDAQADAVMAVTRQMELLPAIDRNDFKLATAIWLQRYSGTQNFGWSPWVAHAQRERFEQALSDSEGGRLFIKGRDAQGGVFVAPPAGSYLPIQFVEPYLSNEAVLGLDVSVLPATAAAVAQALSSGQPHVTEGLRLVQEAGEQRGVVLYQAAYRVGADAQPRGSREVRGVVSAVFRMDDVMRAALGSPESGALELCLIDPAAAADNQRLAGGPGCRLVEAHSARQVSSRPVRFASRQWVLQVTSGPAFASQQRGLVAWGTLTVSLVAVGVLGVFLIVITGHTRRTQQLVRERTKELAVTNERLQSLAMFDALTGLPNRSHWMLEAQRALESARRHGDRFAVAFVDLDHFKDVNDTLGHSVGDELLKAVARRLQDCLRAQDVMARQGGDEFVVLLDRLTSSGDAVAVAAKMVDTLSAPFALGVHEVRVSVSIGLDAYEGGHQDIETLLSHADMAMYRAKAAGRNGWSFYQPEMATQVAQRLMVEQGLSAAMTAGQLVLHYQPQVSGQTGAVTGVEALVRWKHPELGLLLPHQFVPQAENSGHIDELGAWVLRHACQQLRAWHDSGVHDLMVAVNVSAIEFARSGFGFRLLSIIQDTGINPQWLELEITETALMQSLPDLAERLGEIQRMGVRLSLDDFGTGYSSLGYLKRLPLRSIKIDRSFVRDLPGDKEDEAIVRATLSMAHALGLEVVAEGVEIAPQRAFLQAEGCDHLQGWLIARPMDAATFEHWWRRHTAALRGVA
jgi:diguanylate cyclase (GGDEF)-like protein